MEEIWNVQVRMKNTECPYRYTPEGTDAFKCAYRRGLPCGKEHCPIRVD